MLQPDGASKYNEAIQNQFIGLDTSPHIQKMLKKIEIPLARVT